MEDGSDIAPKKLAKSTVNMKNGTPRSVEQGFDWKEARLEFLSSPDENIYERKKARNVGGWQKVAFASQVDRTWTYKNSADSEFDPSFYVPQVGDIVLYYVAGHKAFLEAHPDVLGRELQNVCRVPLWERATHALSAANPGFNEASVSHETLWWNEQWISEVERGINCYPILCKVEGTHTEFPPKRNVIGYLTKVGDSTTIRQVGAKLRLRIAVRLCPIAPLVPPTWKGCNVEPSKLRPPPTFTIVTFPSNLEPFIIPFTWAYTLRHSLSINSTVHIEHISRGEFRIEGFTTLMDDHYGSFDLEDKADLIRKLVSRIQSKSKYAHGLKDELGKEFHSMLDRESRVLLDVLNAFLMRPDAIKCSKGLEESNVRLDCLVLATLPLWKCVTLTPVVNDTNEVHVSPWSLKMPGFYRTSPWLIGRHSFSIERVLRTKMQKVISDFMKKEDAGDFLDPVTEDNAPQYYSAVPLGICLSTIHNRLSTEATCKGVGELYRSAEAVLEDIRGLFENCLLYNDPTSEIVEVAVKLVSSLETMLRRTVSAYNEEVSEARERAYDRSLLVFRKTKNSRGSSSTQVFGKFQQMIEKPFTEPLCRTWLEVYDQNLLTRVLPTGVTASADATQDIPEIHSTWIPQAGDRVLYSETLHKQFIAGHHRSLHPSQSLIHVDKVPYSDKEQLVTPTDHFLRSGEIVRTYAVFPRAVNKPTKSDSTVVVNAPIMCLLLKFPESDELVKVYWQPCLATIAESTTTDYACPLCGIPFSTSFLQHDQASECSKASVDVNTRIDEQKRESIISCFSLLKQRCIDSTPIVEDRKINKASLMAGRIIRPVALRDLSRYRVFYGNDTCATTQESTGRSRFSTLVQSGFIPNWIADDGNVDTDRLSLTETVLVRPNLCLDFILDRLQCGFYRSTNALENDILEGYVSTVVSRLFDLGKRKPNPLSTDIVLNLLCSRQITSESTDAFDSNQEQYREEANIVQVFQKIRDLYAVAMVCVSETFQASFRLGLQGIGIAHVSKDVENMPSREIARLKVAQLIDSFDINNHYKSRGNEDQKRVHLKFFCNGKYAFDKRDDVVPVLTHAMATWNGTNVKVKIVCGNNAYSHKIRKNAAAYYPDANLLSQRMESVRVHSIPFYASDCKGDDGLAKLLFGKENHQHPCARCREKGQSFFSCRVAKAHTSPDFNWLSVLGGVGGIDGLLFTLRTGHIAKPLPVLCSDDTECTALSNAAVEYPEETLLQPETRYSESCQIQAEYSKIEFEQVGSHARRSDAPSQPSDFKQTTCFPEHAEACPVVSHPEQFKQNVDESHAKQADVSSKQSGASPEQSKSQPEQSKSNPEQCDPQSQQSEEQPDGIPEDPSNCLEEAKHIYDIAEQLFDDARTYSEAPIRLSADFVDGFPVDDDDDHYIYCIICGLIGDLLCCDGCPNTVHHQCIGLQKIPDGDWYCEECELKKKGNTQCYPNHSPFFAEAQLPFGRLEFDDNRIDDLSKWLDEFREKRGVQKQKIEDIALESCDITLKDESVSQIEEDVLPVKRRRGRPSKTSTGNVDASFRSSRPPKSRNPTILFCDSESSSDSSVDTKRRHRPSKRKSPFIDDTDDVMSIDSNSSLPLVRIRPRNYCHGKRFFDLGLMSNQQQKSTAPETTRNKRPRRQGKRSYQRGRTSRSQANRVRK